MALTVNILNRYHAGNRKRRIVDIIGDNSYATGGEPISPSDVGLTNIDALIFSHAQRGGAVTTDEIAYDGVNGKVIIVTRAGVEVANLSDQSTYVGRCEVVGQ